VTEAAPVRVIVQKYGGTSVADETGRAAMRARVRATLDSGARLVVVVSAMGRAGSPYATDTLLGLLDARSVDPRESDMLSACGEVISAVVVAHELRADGIPAIAMTGAEAGVLTDDNFQAASVLLVDPAPLRTALESGRVPVVAGFQGVTAAGETTTLGRGGSDTSACVIGAALKAEAVEIYTDVDGVMTADPRTCDGVHMLQAVEYEELFQMARHGSKVMHAPAAQTAMEAGVPVWIRNTFSEEPGTLIAHAERVAAERRARVATAVSHVPDLARMRVALPEDDIERQACITRVFREMADAGVSLDMFTPLEGMLVFSMQESAVSKAQATLDEMGMPHETDDGLAKVTLVGAGMHGVPGVMARVAEALSGAGVSMLQVSDSHTTISVLVPDGDTATAVAALHEAFGLGDADSGTVE
jgi:aspartate kinase